MVVRSLLFVHSPLLGSPSSLRCLADLAAADEFEVALPDLAATVSSGGSHEQYTTQAIEAGKDLASRAGAMRKILDRQTENGRLRGWLDWWSPEVVARILPDPADRAELAGDAPRAYRAFYDRNVAVPTRWSDRACGYVQLSNAYAADAEEARARGWPIHSLSSTHLAAHTRPDAVLEAILVVLDQTRQPER